MVLFLYIKIQKYTISFHHRAGRLTSIKACAIAAGGGFGVNAYITVGSALLGYILGSVSMTRLIGRLFAPGEDFSRHDYKSSNGDVVSFDIASATNVSYKLGAKFGCLVSILDMLKIFAPTLFLKLAFPESPYFLITAATGVVGHNFPLFHRFRGGAGLSAAMGGLLAVDWLSVVVAPVVGMILGLGIGRDVYIASTLWLFLLIPWFWIRAHDWAHIFYAAFILLSFLLATIPVTKQYIRLRKKGPEALLAFYQQVPMGRGLVKIGRLFGLYKNKA
jgi:glycerol-3-phosphate acyltransferase PlsY